MTKMQKLQIDPRLPCGTGAFNILSEPTVLFAWCMSTSSFDESSHWNSRRTLSGKEWQREKKAALAWQPRHITQQLLTDCISHAALANLKLLTYSLHAPIVTWGDKPARTEKFPLCSLFRIGYVSFVVDPLGYILLKLGIFSVVHTTSAVFFWCLQRHGDLHHG